MDVIYVRSQGLIKSPNPSSNQARRAWFATIAINDRAEFAATIVDPFLESEYKTVFEHYLRDSDRQRWSPEVMSMILEQGVDDIAHLEHLIRVYGDQLWRLLTLEKGLSPNATECHLYIIDSQESGDSPSIHCLAWELLEGVRSDWMPGLRLRVTRISDVLPLTPPLRFSRPNALLPHSFASVQADTSLDFHVLLVVARDFSRTGAERDPEPDLAQWPLMNVQRKLRSRMLLEVVRPGSREDLEEHLKLRASQGMYFHLVHFDLHGRIMNDECVCVNMFLQAKKTKTKNCIGTDLSRHGVQTPWLLFASQNHVPRSHGYQVPQTHLAKAEAVAQVLARYKIENVVLNACLSAYTQGPSTSLAHIFLQHGIYNVSAMWFYVHWQTVSTYLEAFYEELLVWCKDFHFAAHRGREAIRQKPTSRIGRDYEDYFLCVNYTRNVPVKSGPVREPSPAPSARSQGSTTSNTSVTSFMRKASVPRLGDQFIGDEPLIRMQLHLLELEYKLMTSRVVYASDLRRPGSKLAATIDQMVSMWLNTNLVDEVFYYKAKDFARPRILPGAVKPREKRTRATNGGYLQLLFQPKSVRALRQTLHVVYNVDTVVAPGYLADPARNADLERRRFLAQAGLQRFAERLHADRHSYLLFLGSEDAQWWRTYLQHLQGEWWVHLPWSYTVHSRKFGM
ncbi:TPR repeat-containing protein [Mariannaea sp. PMI_226]|nr:TPR repeat-containing protein [Mariannaea sp. PMI_226]